MGADATLYVQQKLGKKWYNIAKFPTPRDYNVYGAVCNVRGDAVWPSRARRKDANTCYTDVEILVDLLETTDFSEDFAEDYWGCIAAHIYWMVGAERHPTQTEYRLKWSFSQ